MLLIAKQTGTTSKNNYLSKKSPRRQNEARLNDSQKLYEAITLDHTHVMTISKKDFSDSSYKKL